MKPVKNLDSIVQVLEQTLELLGIEAVEYYLWQGRARGAAGGDVDIYIQVSPEHEELTQDLDLINRTTRERSDVEAHSYMWICGEELVDARIGVGNPPEEPYYNLVELKHYCDRMVMPQDCLEITGDEKIFNVFIDHPDVRKGACNQWMVSCPGIAMDTGYYHEFYRDKAGSVAYQPRCEILFSGDAHQSKHNLWGTQPFSSYLRGSTGGCMGVASGEEWFEKPEHLFPERWITCQQYYKSDKRPGDFTYLQYKIDIYCLTRLLDGHWIKPSTKVYLEDHSHDWKAYICHPFIVFEAEEILEALNRPDGLKRFREYSLYGKQYDERERAVRCLTP